MNELALFAGAGGGILGGHLLGWRTVCAVEWEPYPASVLVARQNDGILPPFPVWDDVQTFDGRPWRGLVDVVSGGFPCQDISAAGGGAGIDGERSGMWKHMARIVGEVRPSIVFVENSPLLVGRGLAVVLGDLTALGYDAEWFCLSASNCGAPHQRDRIWLVANANGIGSDGWRKRYGRHEGLHRTETTERCSHDFSASRCCEALAYADRQRQQEQHVAAIADQPRQHSRRLASGGGIGRWPTEPDVGRVADGVAARVDRLKAIGNGQVPRVAAAAFALLASDGGSRMTDNHPREPEGDGTQAPNDEAES